VGRVPRVASLLLVAGLMATGCGGSASSHASRPSSAVPAAAQIANGPVAAAKSSTLPLGHSRAPVPVLMYHVIASAPPAAAYGGLWVPPAALRAQVAALAGAGFNGVTLDAVLDAWSGKDTLPPHPVVLSFDDGYLSQGKDAAAILAEYGWPGVLNLAWHNLGTPGGLTKGRVLEMIRAGWEIDAHSLTHPDLTTASAAQLAEEVRGSRAEIQRAFGVAADAFCYPAGKFDAAVEAVVRAAGYRAATTERPGAASPHDDPYALPRIRVNAGDSAAAVVRNVRSALGSGR
jgi:peptidoglycan/xylan/chitin deacetylase (PgdA/CDA1 family)